MSEKSAECRAAIVLLANSTFEGELAFRAAFLEVAVVPVPATRILELPVFKVETPSVAKLRIHGSGVLRFAAGGVSRRPKFPCEVDS